MMTPKQRNLLRYIEAYIEENDGISPSFQQMADHLGLKSKSGVHRLVEGLVYRNKIRRLPHRARAIEVVRVETEMSVQRLKDTVNQQLHHNRGPNSIRANVTSDVIDYLYRNGHING